MRQVGGGLRLTTEAFDEGAVDRQLRKEDLQRHRAVEQAVVGAIDLGHPPRATRCASSYRPKRTRGFVGITMPARA